MTDVLDAGTDLAEQDRDGAWKAQQQASILRAAAVVAYGTSLTCLDCELAIPKKRREAAPGCRRCTDCEKDNERLRKLQGR